MKDIARYNYYKELHPEWSDEQIWTAISIDMQAAKTIKEGGDDVDVHNPELIKVIISKAENWLREVLPVIWEKVKQFFAKTLDTVIEWAKQGWEYLLNLLNTPNYL